MGGAHPIFLHSWIKIQRKRQVVRLIPGCANMERRNDDACAQAYKQVLLAESLFQQDMRPGQTKLCI